MHISYQNKHCSKRKTLPCENALNCLQRVNDRVILSVLWHRKFDQSEALPRNGLM